MHKEGEFPFNVWKEDIWVAGHPTQDSLQMWVPTANPLILSSRSSVSKFSYQKRGIEEMNKDTCRKMAFPFLSLFLAKSLFLHSSELFLGHLVATQLGERWQESSTDLKRVFLELSAPISGWKQGLSPFFPLYLKKVSENKSRFLYTQPSFPYFMDNRNLRKTLASLPSKLLTFSLVRLVEVRICV